MSEIKKISVFTATRAEYHLLYHTIKKINEDRDLELDLIVSGTHLSREYGHTIDEIIKDGFKCNCIIETIVDGASVDGIIAKTLLGCSDHFKNSGSDFLIVLGDRYEIMGAVLAAANQRIPIAHIHGGETTEGAIDEAVRHAVSKFSYIHFTSCEAYRKRVIQLGESPDRVFDCGALGVENIKNQCLMSREELENNLEFDLSNYCVVTFHPVTLENNTMVKQLDELMEALLCFKNMNYIITKANADEGGKLINDKLEEYAEKHPQIKLVASLGMVRYLSSIMYSNMVIGNSSSGILEAPYFHVPTINIGDRQKGRIQTDSVINCEPKKNEIIDAIKKGLSKEFNEKIKDMKLLYGDGNSSEIIVRELKETLIKGVNLKKKFFDIEF